MIEVKEFERNIRKLYFVFPMYELNSKNQFKVLQEMENSNSDEHLKAEMFKELSQLTHFNMNLVNVFKK